MVYIWYRIFVNYSLVLSFLLPVAFSRLLAFSSLSHPVLSFILPIFSFSHSRFGRQIPMIVCSPVLFTSLALASLLPIWNFFV